MTTVSDVDCLRHLDEDGVLELASALVRIRTVADPSAPVVEAPAAALVADLMRSFGWLVSVTDVAPGRPNVVAIVNGTETGPGTRRTLMFEGHSDVVTEGDPADWTFDPFGGDVVDGRLRGRGSADMKGGVAAMIYAARAVQLSGFAGRIVVAVLADEEGLMLGAKAFAASGLAAEIDGVIVCEPEAGEICPTSKGALRVGIELTGKMAHGAMPQMGLNPIPALAQLLLGLAELEEQLQRRYPAHPDLGQFYLTPTVLAAGTPAQLNVISATATLYLDIRTIPGIDHRGLVDVLGMLSEQVAAGAGVTAAVTVLDDRPPVDLRRDAPVVVALAAAHEQVTGAPAVYGGVPGTTDGTILTRDAGLETVVYGPGGKWIAHQADEFVEVADLLQSARVLAVAASRFLAT
jgi:succinyl-diaminopimelate desuccinylase